MRTLALILALAPALPQAATLSDAMQAYAEGRAGEAAAQFYTLAQTGNARAQFNLALLFYSGAGVPENHSRAFEWAWRAKLHGLAEAGSLLTKIGDDIPDEVRDELADRLREELLLEVHAANTRAIIAVAIIENELRAEPDLIEVYVWYSLAVALGHAGAEPLRDKTFAGLASEDRIAAQEASIDRLGALCSQTSKALPVCSIF